LNSLGLMIVKSLVDQMFGTIKLINTSGTTFKIDIPLKLLLEKQN
jgi:two-component sensor histidine kinase